MMGVLELFMISIGLSMDAFAVAVCKGLSIKKVRFRDAFAVGLYFGLFQAIMPLLGYFVGVQFAGFITDLDHWIAFILLALIGGNMIKESMTDDCPTAAGSESLRPKEMVPLALATSIDALAVGVSFAFLDVQIVPAVTFIGVITLVLSMVGVVIGKGIGDKFKSKAELVGGIVLILIGVKILLEHLGVFG